MIAPAPKMLRLSGPRHRPLSVAEETAVVAILRRGGPVAQRARHKLVNANLKFVVAVARKFITCGIPMDDLINEGAAGLIKATHLYEPAHGKFLSYAVWWIRQAILYHLHDQAHTIKLPSPASLKAKLVRAEETAKRPSRTARATTPEKAQEEITAILRLRDMHSTEDLMESGWEPHDPSQDPAAGLHARDRNRTVQRFLETVAPRDRAVVMACFGMDTGESATLEEVGQRFNLTRERVRQIKDAALMRMRQQVRGKGVDFTL